MSDSKANEGGGSAPTPPERAALEAAVIAECRDAGTRKRVVLMFEEMDRLRRTIEESFARETAMLAVFESLREFLWKAFFDRERVAEIELYGVMARLDKALGRVVAKPARSDSDRPPKDSNV